MLARPQRLTRGIDYRTVVRRGARCGGASVVAHVVHTHDDRPARFGFIVSKAVGNAVVRNTVRRRLKAICHELAPTVRDGADVVFRAHPSAATTEFADLRAQVARCLERKAAA